MEKLSDNELIRLIVVEQKGKYRDALYERYSGKVFNRCYSYLKNRDLATEFVQEIFIKAFEKLPGFRQSSSFSTWLYTIAINYCIDYSRKKDKRVIVEYMASESLPDVIDDLIPEDEMHVTQYDRFMNILTELPPTYQEVIRMKYIENKKITEIQIILGLNESNVKMRIKRAKELLILKFYSTYGKTIITNGSSRLQ